MQNNSPPPPSDDLGSNPRRQRRRWQFKSGSIVSADLAISAECVVKDYHSSGAKLAFEDAAGIPNMFTLIIPDNGTEVECKIVWKGPKEIGVEFVSLTQVYDRNTCQKT